MEDIQEVITKQLNVSRIGGKFNLAEKNEKGNDIDFKRIDELKVNANATFDSSMSSDLRFTCPGKLKVGKQDERTVATFACFEE